MKVGPTIRPQTRARWRAWLTRHHAVRTEIWLLYRRYGLKKGEAPPTELTYLDAVEEALCFGWVDGIGKKHQGLDAQRFTPRRPRSHWTELNKHRARRLIEAGRMTPAGRAILPDLDAPFVVPDDIRTALSEDPDVWRTFCSFPDLYRRVRVGYVDELRRTNPDFLKRLAHLVAKTRQGKMFGNWDDAKLPRSSPRPSASTSEARDGPPDEEE
ncbi:MAG: YdeI/OmpD-associated family protein [Myxococcota bacterium]